MVFEYKWGIVALYKYNSIYIYILFYLYTKVPKSNLKTAVVLGSGGHTMEMIKMLNGVDTSHFRPREYIVAETDKMSLQKLHQFESSLDSATYNVHRIYRSRHVGQSYLTSIFTTLLAILYSIPMMLKIKPDVLLVNGPGTCVPCCLIIFLFSRLFRLLPRCKIVFIESICRVTTLSLTGKIFYHLRICDSFLVQWPELKAKYPRVTYIGRLV